MKLSHPYYESDDGWFVVHFDDYPDYDTQGRSLEELQTMLNERNARQTERDGADKLKRTVRLKRIYR